MKGSAKRNILMFQELCGEDALKKVILASTMWDTEPRHVAEGRERQLIETPQWWGWMMDRGSQVYRHYNTSESAMKIVRVLADGGSKVKLDLQTQMVDENLRLDETTAGKSLNKELDKERAKWSRELAKVEKRKRKLSEMESSRRLISCRRCGLSIGRS